MLARVHHERSGRAQDAFPPPDRLLDERGRGQVPKNPRHVRDPMVFDSIFTLDRTEVLHTKVLQFWRGAFSTATRRRGKGQMLGISGARAGTGLTTNRTSRTSARAVHLPVVSPRWTAFLLIVSTLPFAIGCGRKAPGPDECHELAVRWVSQQSPGRGIFVGPPGIGYPRRRVLTAPLDEEEVEKRTTLCLTTPYDRALVACVQAVGAIGECYRAFEARHGGVSVPFE